MVSVSPTNSSSQASKVKHSQVHHGALVQAAAVKKKSKKKSTVASEKRVVKSDKKSKSSKLRPQKDIGNATSRAARSDDDSSSEASKGSDLFSTWSGDALSLFMFKVAPLIMRINFELRSTLSQAQQTEVQNQIKSANLSAQFTMQKGESEAQQMRLQAGSAIAGGVTGLAGMGQGALELGSTNGVMEDELAFQDKALSDLSVNKGAALDDETVGHGEVSDSDSAIEETPTSKTSEEIAADKAQARELAKRFKAAHEKSTQSLQEQEEASPDSFKDKLAKSKVAGLAKKDAQLKLEKNIALSKSAGSTVFQELIEETPVEGAPSVGDTLEKIYSDPDVAAEFMDELGASLDLPDTALNSLRGMPGESVGKILRSYGKTSEAESFKTKIENTRTNVTSRMAAHERRMLDSGLQKRQLLSQVVQGFSSGATSLLSVSQKLTAASAEAQATMANAQASVMASVRGAQDGSISGALDQVRGLMEWYSQMESQVIGAVTQSMA